MSLQPSLQLLDFLDETVQVRDWYTLGVYMKLSPSELSQIGTQFSNLGPKRCKIEMFDLWTKSNPDASWELIAQALDRCGEQVLAKHIRTRYLPSDLATTKLSRYR